MKRNKSVLLFFVFYPIVLFSQVRLPHLISDGMVLQRDTKVKIWGWAAANEKVSVHFIDSTYQTTANDYGEWQIILPALKAGGPFKMQISASNEIIINDILVGDIWVCSGQSNMELPMRRVKLLYENEIAESENKNIRYFAVPQRYNFKEPQNDLPFGIWKPANPENVLTFSAVAYFFAKELYNKYKVPIGLINASLGGSPAEAWMSEEALKKFPIHYNELQRYKNDQIIKQIEDEDNARIKAWYDLLGKKDKGYNNPDAPWTRPDINTSGWKTMQIPGYWSDSDSSLSNGVVWFRKSFRLPSYAEGKKALLFMGRIVDADSVFINGIFVGTTSYQYPPRIYNVPEHILKAGENKIVARIISNIGRGGFVPDKPYHLIVENDTIDLKGEWQYKEGASMEPLMPQTFIRWKPAGLYNAMIAPIVNYTIKGVIWYQGESNAERPIEYRTLFPAMINDWRDNWKDPNLPFIYAQLPNFMEPKNQLGESNWALLREAQFKTLSLKNTGMSVNIDLGEWNDIHPLNKKDVGFRLALAAQKVAYGENIVGSGPLYQSHQKKGGKIVVSFTNCGGGLIAKGGNKLEYFTIAGADKKFVWADAKIKGNKVIVWNKEITKPVAVRYAWADNPEGANLYNKEGLPASPFRTDEW